MRLPRSRYLQAAPADEVCSCTRATDGRLCPQPAAFHLGSGLYACEYHAYAIEQTIDARVQELRQVDSREAHGWEDRRRSRQESTSRVYYAELADGFIKIGTSNNVDRRLKQLNPAMYPSPVLLVSEQGGRRKERRRHEQFIHLRYGATEKFRPAPDLLGHIESLRRVAVEV